MSTTSSQTTPDASPMTVQPLHHPEQAAKVVIPQAPLGNTTNAPGMGGKALIAKKMVQTNTATVSPSDLIQTPCTAKLSSIKQNRFNKSKPIRFAFNKGDEATREDEPESPLEQQQDGDVMKQDEDHEMDDGERAPVASKQSTLPPAEF